jgi:hypothetical protein
MSRIIVKDLSTTMDDTIAGSTQVYVKNDGSAYAGLYSKSGTDAERIVGNPAVDGSSGIIRYNDQILNATVTIPDSKNAFSAGPLEIASGKTVTIGAGSYWTII